jgi:phospholipase/carboxylesterase
MPSRRATLLPRFAVLTAVVLSFACRHDAETTPGASESFREQTVLGVHFVEIFAHGASESSPLVVAIHGQGGNPEHFATRLGKEDLPDPVEIALPQAFERFGWGWSWFDWPPGLDDGEAAARVGAAEEKLWRAIAEIAHGRKVIVTGFSQGGILSYVLAARHPDAIVRAFPISGGAPDRLLPRNRARAAPVYAMHGADDDVIPVNYARATVDAFRRQGDTAELHEFSGVGHTITPAMRADLWAHIHSALTAP